MNVATGSSFVGLAAILLGWGGTAAASDVTSGGDETITIKGFVSATVFAQDHSFAFGNGQNAQWPIPGNGHPEDPWFVDGDVRNTRLTVGLNGPEVGSLKLGGTIEADFFGGYNGELFASDEQPIPRLRLAFADLKLGCTTIRVGQFWSPLFGNVPASVSHLAFPIGYGSAGFVGWRFPGIFIYHKLSPAEAPLQMELQLGIFRGSWAGPGSNVASLSAGNASWLPQVELRFNISGAKWSAYVVGHYDRKDLSGRGSEAAADYQETMGTTAEILPGYAGEVGAKVRIDRILVHGNAYYGRAIGQQFGHIVQFGDIGGWGAWGQIGFDITQELGIFAFYGIDNPDDDDVLDINPTNGRLRNQIMAGMLRYQVGPYAVGVEYLHAELLNGEEEKTAVGNQVSASVLYKF